MQSRQSGTKKTYSVRNIFWFSVLCWTSAITGLLFWGISEHRHELNTLATYMAEAHFEKERALRLWAASRGGIYVPVDENTKPNPLLEAISDRDAKTPTGKSLTLIPGFHMVRQLREEFPLLYGVKGATTSLKPLRKENSPDEWQKSALESFDKGVTETKEFTNISGEPYLRLMRPHPAQEGCLSCHAKSGFKEGDILGGIEISFPLKEFQIHHKRHSASMIMSHGAIYILGLFGLVIGRWKLQTREAQRDSAELSLKTSELNLRQIYEKSPVMMQSVNQDGYFVSVNDQWLQKSGYTAPEVIGKKNDFVLAPDFTEYGLSETTESWWNRQINDLSCHFTTKDGTKIDVLLSSKIVSDSEGNPITLAVLTDVTDINRISRELKKSEERYRNLVETSSDMVLRADGLGHFVFVNKIVPILTGYSEDELIGRHFLELVAPEYRDSVEKFYNVQFAKKSSNTYFELPLLLKNSEIMWVGQNVQLLEIAEESYVFQSIARDITLRKKAEQALQESEERYRSLVEDSFEGIFIQKGSEIVFANARLYEMLGYEPGELQGQENLVLYDPLFHDLIKKRSDARLRGENVTANYEVGLRRKDGTCFDGEITARAVSFASSPGIQVWVRDITERKAVQEALRHSEEKYRMIFRYSPVGILHFDETGTITDLNDKCVKMIGSSRDRLIGLNMLSQLQDWKIKECVKKALCGHVAYFEGTYSSVTAEKLTPISSYFGPVVNEKNLPIGGVGIVEDLTDRIRAEQELRDSEERFRTLVQNLMDPVLIMDFDGSIHFANDAAFELFGVPSDQDVSSIGIESFLSPENYAKVLADLSTVRSTGGPLITEYPITTSFGEERWIEASGHLTLWHGEPKDIISLRDITERKFTENAIRQSEERYRSLYRMVRLMCDNVPDLIWAKDLDRRFIFTNRAICDRLLCADSTDEPVGKTDMFFAERERTAQPENPEWHTFGGICLDSDSIVMNTGQTQRFDEFGNVRGEFLHLDVHKAPLRNEKGEMIGTVGCGRDVTKERAIEEALRESEYRYRDLFDKAIDLIYTHDLDGNYMSCNAAVNALFGYTPDEFLKMNFREILHPDHLEVAMQNMVKKIDGTMDTTGPYEVLIKTKTGISKWVEVVSRTIREGGKPVSVHGICRDITDRKLAEQELAEAKHYLDRIINSIADPVFVKNENHQWVLLNEAYCNFMGYSAKELLGKSDYDFFPTNEADIFWKKDEEVFSSGRENINQEQFTDKDGTTHTIVTKKTLCVDPGGRKYLVGVIRDITEIIQFHEERRNLESQLRHAHRMEAIGTLAGGIAHDFNNLLQVTLGYSEFLISQKSKDHPDYPDLQKINQAALSGAELVKGLLTFSRKVESKPEILNLNAGIIHIEQLLRRTMPKMISIRFNLAGDLMQVSADPVQIEQILMNLAINSRDAISESGSITISTRNVQPSDDLFRIHPETMCQDFVEMAVSDDGSGMDQETIDHIFDPFYTTKEVGRGTGLGLAMVYGIVKQHSGYILCRSEIGKGTIFRIYFPAIPSTKIVDVNTSGEMPIMGTETILLVEDEFLVRELGERTLRGHGYEVLTATNGQEALEIFVRLRDRISLIILDMIMPTMSGRDCLKKILEIDPNARVIIASGHSAETSLAECIELGAKEFIPKPFRFTKLLKLIRTILDEE